MRRMGWLLALLMLCGGCARLPGEERSFVVALCVDADETGWHMAARVPSYQEAGHYLTVEARADTPQLAWSRLDAAAPMRLHPGQMRLLAVGSRAASGEGLWELLSMLQGMPELRREAVLLVTDDEIGQVCSALEPLTGTRLSKSLDALIRTRREQGVITGTTIGECIWMADRQAPVMGVLTAAPGERPSVMLGASALVDAEGRVTARIDEEQTKWLQLLQGKWRRGSLTADGTVLRVNDAAVSIQWEGETAQIRVKLMTAQPQETPEALERAAAREILAVAERLTAAGCDALGLARQAILRFDTQQAWLEADWPEAYRNLKWQVDVTVQAAR